MEEIIIIEDKDKRIVVIVSDGEIWLETNIGCIFKTLDYVNNFEWIYL